MFFSRSVQICVNLWMKTQRERREERQEKRPSNHAPGNRFPLSQNPSAPQYLAATRGLTAFLILHHTMNESPRPRPRPRGR